ncbi:MAG: hypothetical protein AB7P49_13775, partial [Bdellovibrionales bacterium]
MTAVVWPATMSTKDRDNLSTSRLIWKRFLVLFPYLILVGALGFLYGELKNIDWGEFRKELMSRPPTQILTALGLVLVNYLWLSFYDLLSLRQLGRRLPLLTVVTTSFAAFSITNTVGHSLVTGLGIRLKRYKDFGLGAGQIARLVLLNMETWWIGFLFLMGAVIVNVPIPIQNLGFTSYITSLVGLGLLILTALYLGACLRMAGGKVRFFGREMTLPDLSIGIQKVFIGAVDTFFVSLTLYVLLPPSHSLSFLQFFSFHLTAHLTGIVTMVPGGLGVLEG